MTANKLITIVFGTRPEAIKLAPLIIAFKKSNVFQTRVIFTGQHREMVEQVIKIFDIEYDLNLNLMRHNQTLSHITNEAIIGLEKEFQEFKPKLLIVQGDTSTAFAAALAASYNKIPIAHVEAGLRTNNLMDPFPEEINRRLISQISTLHFAPTKKSLMNLTKCGVSGKIYVTGNTVIDSLFLCSKKETSLPTKKTNWVSNDVIFATIHRRENWGQSVVSIANAFIKILNEMPKVSFVIPMHPNLKVRNPIKEILGNHPRIELIEPLDYPQSVSCMMKSKLIMTDSGGIQEEAPSISKPVLVLRNTTERTEAIEAGTAKLIGTNTEMIFEEALKLLKDKNAYLKMVNIKNPYGDGKSSERILEICSNFLKQ